MGLMGTSAARRRSIQPAPTASPTPAFSIGPTGQMQQQAPPPPPQVSAGKWQPGVQSGGQSQPSSVWDSAQGRGGMAQSKQNMGARPDLLNALPDTGGVVAGAPASNAVDAYRQQQGGGQPAFDPNDPNNAALLGYMNAGAPPGQGR